MLKLDQLAIPVTLDDGKFIELKIFAESNSPLFLEDISTARENGESPFQIQEGCFYEYKITQGYLLEGSEIISRSKVNLSTGRVSPNIYVGSLIVNILDETGEWQGEVILEVRSSKTSYRDDYRTMLSDITERCIELVMQSNSPVSQHFETDFERDATTLYQRFIFIRSILDTEEFKESIQKVTSSPIVAWEPTQVEKDTRSIKRIDNRAFKKIITGNNRSEIPTGHPLKEKLKTLPRKIEVTYKKETVDNPENRFIKHALTTFMALVDEIITRSKAGTKVHTEAKMLEDRLSHYLSHSIFKELSSPSKIPLNSPVLQRKEGYREIFRTWLMIDLAAKLIWKGGDDVFDGGKKHIALLYEYWVFFRLLDIIKEVFQIQPKSIESLVQKTKDGLGLQLRQGKYLPIEGIFESPTRKLNIEFSYNRTFSGDNSYPNGGSWTRQLRPDYTLSIWPFGISAERAEIEELIVHLHFDAKYKVDDISNIFKTDDNVEDEKLEQKKGNYKRADLLKMHTYRDAIRRTAGAYILYPGSDHIAKKGFHELLPGVGAFAIAPSKSNPKSIHLISFLRDVLKHFLNRASQREAMQFRTYDIHKNGNTDNVNELLPELIGKNRGLLPDQTYILVAFYRSQEHLDWIMKNGLYNARAEDKRGSLRLGSMYADAKYLLLHTYYETTTSKLFKVLESPRIFSKQNLIEKNYPSEPSQEFYLVYKIDSTVDKEFKNYTWKFKELKEFASGHNSALPFATTLKELMKVIKK